MDSTWVTEDAVLIIGAGHFGARAARIIRHRSDGPIFVVDPDKEALDRLKELRVERIIGDGIGFLTENFGSLKETDTIVPALPIHLAYEWLRGTLAGEMDMKRVPVPETDSPLPNAYRAGEGSTLVSYADFICPDDCPEPAFCTVTGKRREQPLYALLGDIHLPRFRVHIIRSRQIAPGLGGYRVRALKSMARDVKSGVPGRWIIGTACKCHGILTGFEISERQGPRDSAPEAQPVN